jgi:predicted AAA+ superfamily ATPase
MRFTVSQNCFSVYAGSSRKGERAFSAPSIGRHGFIEAVRRKPGRAHFLFGAWPIRRIGGGTQHYRTLWVRGGFPRSFLADNDALSMEWRRNFIRTYLEREVPQFGSRIPAETLRRFWTMLAHKQAQMLNAANLARALGVDGKTIASYLDLLVRDSGIAHAFLSIRDKEALLSHPVVGQTWESFVTETLIAVAPDGTEAHYYRTSNGAEVDLVLTQAVGYRNQTQLCTQGGARFSFCVRRSQAE